MTGLSLALFLLLPPPGLGPDHEVTDTSCIVMAPVSDRLSPLDSVTFSVDGRPVKICYGRPSARGRTMLGGKDVPFGQLWRTGANEPTMIHTTVSLRVAGITLEPGSYSFYTVPGSEQWALIVNRSITQWGHIARYTAKVKAQEVGRAMVPAERLERHRETLTLRAEPQGPGAVTLLIDWEHTRLRIPIEGRLE